MSGRLGHIDARPPDDVPVSCRGLPEDADADADAGSAVASVPGPRHL